MSYKHLEWAWKVDLAAMEKLVLVCLAHHANKDTGLAFPSRERITEYTGASRTSVYRYLKLLEGKGLIHRSGVGRWKLEVTDVSTGDDLVSHGDEMFQPETEMFHHETHNSKELEMNGNEKAQSAKPKPKMTMGSAKEMLSYVEDRKKGEQERKKDSVKNIAYLFVHWVKQYHDLQLCSLTGKDHGMLTTYKNKVGQNAVEYLEKVVKEWDDFRLFLKQQTGTYYEAQVPQLAIIVKQASFVKSFCEQAVQAEIAVVSAPIVSKEATKPKLSVQVADDGEFNFD